uniref:PI-PLC Y-box domain-containing protein n=1 Tax=Chrysotila carterae TaxID=13221 RepID=A0A7S4BXW7_CHRCT
MRTRSDNYDPLPCWASGAQLCALNLQTNDLPTQLHYALFELNGGRGYVEKPKEMVMPVPCWPPPQLLLKVVTVQPITLFQLPKRGEDRPCLTSSRSRLHNYVSELSFASMRSGKRKQVGVGVVPFPSVSIELHAIGGFHCVSTSLPPLSGATRHVVRTFSDGGGGGDFFYGQEVHCVAAEPMACVLRVAVVDEEAGQEVAYDTVVLGAVREGYRVIHLRSMLGTRIESCYLLVHIAFSTQVNAWVGEHELVQTLYKQRLELDESRAEIAELKSQLHEYKGRDLDRAPKQGAPFQEQAEKARNEDDGNAAAAAAAAASIGIAAAPADAHDEDTAAAVVATEFANAAAATDIIAAAPGAATAAASTNLSVTGRCSEVLPIAAISDTLKVASKPPAFGTATGQGFNGVDGSNLSAAAQANCAVAAEASAAMNLMKEQVPASFIIAEVIDDGKDRDRR